MEARLLLLQVLLLLPTLLARLHCLTPPTTRPRQRSFVPPTTADSIHQYLLEPEVAYHLSERYHRTSTGRLYDLQGFPPHPLITNLDPAMAEPRLAMTT